MLISGIKGKLVSSDYDYFVAKRVAKLRHTQTNYDNHYELMFDENGNPTEFRHHINQVLGKIVKGELDYRYLGGIKSEIKLAKKELDKENRLRKLAEKPSKKRNGFKSIIEQQKDLLKGIKKLNACMDNHDRQVWLSAIGMWKPQLQLKYRNALPYYGGAERLKQSKCPPLAQASTGGYPLNE